MSRGLATNTTAALDDAYLIPVLFVHLDFDTGPLRVHTDLGTITTLSNSWLGTGDLGSVGDIEEGLDLSPYALSLSMSLIDESAGSLFEEALTENFYQRPATLYFGARNTVTGALLDTPDEIFSGRVDQINLIHGKEVSRIQVILESEMADFEKSALLYYSDNTLQSEYAGDIGFEYLDTMVNWSVNWGGSRRTALGIGRAAAAYPAPDYGDWSTAAPGTLGIPGWT